MDQPPREVHFAHPKKTLEIYRCFWSSSLNQDVSKSPNKKSIILQDLWSSKSFSPLGKMGGGYHHSLFHVKKNGAGLPLQVSPLYSFYGLHPGRWTIWFFENTDTPRFSENHLNPNHHHFQVRFVHLRVVKKQNLKKTTWKGSMASNSHVCLGLFHGPLRIALATSTWEVAS